MKSMAKKLGDMSEQEYEAYCKEGLRLDKEIGHISLLMATIDDEGKCPFCHNKIKSLDEIRKGLIQKMREYNEFRGYKYYVAHVEGSKEWKV